ncbi:MAG: cobalamin-binding protein [Armatimonadetes bacterium]|nr:cobalamin-binding protein [Armatimonadota bacterium]
MRIVSLIASATEIVCALGLRDQLVGISHECDFPPDVVGLPVFSRPKVNPRASSAEIDRGVRAIARDGLSVYEIDTEMLEKIAPDLIVTQDQCVVCAVSLKDVEAAVCTVTRKDTRICTLHPETLQDIRADFRKVAQAAGVPERGEMLVREFDGRLHAIPLPDTRPTVACIEWLDPVMVAGGWMSELVEIAGGQPLIVTEPGRFATVTWDDVERADPDVVVVMPCGYPIEQTLSELHADHPLARLRGRCWVADGNAYFNRPGPRIADSAALLARLIHGGPPHEGAVPWGGETHV